MRNQDDGTRVSPKPSNVFAEDFLARLDEADEPATAAEAEVAGLGALQPSAGGFAVFRQGETAERGHEAVGVFRERWRALLVSALLAGTGRDPLVILQKDADPDGYPLLAGLDLDGRPDVVGHLRLFDEALTVAMHVGEALLRSPESLAALLEAAGKVGLERTGTILELRIPGTVG